MGGVTPGQCKFGKNCSYAHGDCDLRDPYQNIDLDQLVKDHYGVAEFEGQALSSLTGKGINEMNTAGADGPLMGQSRQTGEKGAEL